MFRYCIFITAFIFLFNNKAYCDSGYIPFADDTLCMRSDTELHSETNQCTNLPRNIISIVDKQMTEYLHNHSDECKTQGEDINLLRKFQCSAPVYQTGVFDDITLSFLLGRPLDSIKRIQILLKKFGYKTKTDGIWRLDTKISLDHFIQYFTPYFNTFNYRYDNLIKKQYYPTDDFFTMAQIGIIYIAANKNSDAILRGIYNNLISIKSLNKQAPMYSKKFLEAIYNFMAKLKGLTIKDIQALLINKGYYCSKIDGKFKRQTNKALLKMIYDYEKELHLAHNWFSIVGKEWKDIREFPYPNWERPYYENSGEELYFYSSIAGMASRSSVVILPLFYSTVYGNTINSKKFIILSPAGCFTYGMYLLAPRNTILKSNNKCSN
ncbi:hypothetical protein K9F62_11035 [Desulfovibrio sp. JY]|nr:hypothetical protein K9F62_11035 [Desulfovibrio sp. JY]